MTFTDTKKLLIGAGAFTATYAALFAVARNVLIANKSGMYNAHGFTMIGMSYLLGQSPVEDTVSFLQKETLLGLVLTIAVILAVILYKKVKQETILILIAAVQVVLSMNAINHYVFNNQSFIYGDILMGEELKDLRDIYPDRKIVHVYEGGVPYIELVQFEDRDAKIQVLNGEYESVDPTPYITADTILILGENSDFIDMAEDYYDKKIEISHLCMYYME